MGIKFYKSYDIVTLKDKFISNFRLTNIFSENLIIVPNINVKKWLQLEITKKNGIIAGLNILYLESGLFYILKKLFNIDEKFIFLNDRDRLIDLQLLIISILINFSEEEDLNIFRKYYKRENEYDFNALWNISEKLAYYLREYQYQKLDIISKWEKGEYCFFEDDKKDIEKGYKFIYNKLFCEENNYLKKLNDKNDGFIWTTIYNFVNEYFKENINSKNINSSFCKIYIFGLSQISHFHIELLLKLSNYFDIEFYRLDYLFYDTTSHYLGIYSKALHKNNLLIKRIVENSNTTIEEEILKKEMPQDKILDLFKYYILTNKDVCKKNQDESIQIIGCPTIHREVETVYNSIIYNLQKDPRLKLTDIVIFVTDMDKYRYYIENIFNDNGVIMYNINDFTIAEESNFYKAIYSFFNLIDSNFKKDKVLELVETPLFMKKFNLENNDVGNIIRLVSELNIFHSYNIDDKQRISNFTTPYFTWGYGLLRLKLSTLFFNNNEDSLFNIKNSYINETEKLEKVIHIFDNIFYFFNSINKNLTFIQLRDKIIDFINNFLEIEEDDKVENILKEKTFSLLESLTKFENIFSMMIYNNKYNSSMNLNFIKKYILSNIEKVDAQKGSYLSDGVIISKLLPMKPIPFKIGYILGLTEDNFPSISTLSTIDIRNLTKNDNEYITQLENDRYLFLETLFAVQDKLYLLYNNRDLEKDKKIYPSSVINDIILTLENKIIDGNFKVHNTTLFPIDENNEEYRGDISIEKVDSSYSNNYSLLKDNKDSIIKINVNDISDFFINPKRIILKNRYNINLTYYDKNINETIEPFYKNKYDLLNYATKYIIDKKKGINVSQKITQDIEKEIEYGNMPEEIYSEFFIKKIINKVEKIKIDIDNIDFSKLEEIENFYEYQFNEKYIISGNKEKLFLNSDSGNYYTIYVTDKTESKLLSECFKYILRKIFNLLILKEKNNDTKKYFLLIIYGSKDNKKSKLIDLNFDIKEAITYYIKSIYESDCIFNFDINKIIKNSEYSYYDYLKDFESIDIEEDYDIFFNNFNINDEDILINIKENRLTEKDFNDYCRIINGYLRNIKEG